MDTNERKQQIKVLLREHGIRLHDAVVADLAQASPSAPASAAWGGRGLMKAIWHHVFHSTRDEKIVAIGGPGRTYRCMKCNHEYHS